VVRAERHRRGDAVVAASLVVVVGLAAALLAVFSPAANTTSVTAASPVPTVPLEPADVPDPLSEAWRAPSAATTTPVAVGPVVVTGDSEQPPGGSPAGVVLGRDPLTGQPRWSYRRDLPLCAVGSAWDLALAVFRRSGYCGEVTGLSAQTGARGPQRNSDVSPDARLLDDGYLVTASGPTYLETWRSDLVETLSYGAERANPQPDRQPRTGCRHESIAVTRGRLGVLERCAGESIDRLTMLRPDSNETERPPEQFSVTLPTTGARLVAISDDSEAVLAPNPTRLSIRDGTGTELASYPLELPACDLAGDPPGGVVPTAVFSDASSNVVLWWTGSRTVALDASDLRPLWTVPDTLGPGTPWAGRLVVPVPSGLAVVDSDTGAVLRAVPVDRAGYRGPVTLRGVGPILLEQRGPTIVALGGAR